MVKTEYREEFYLKEDLKNVFYLIKTWLADNNYKVKKEGRNYSSLIAKRGGFFSQSINEIEVKLISRPDGDLISILGISRTNSYFGEIAKMEVLGLTTFLKSNFKEILLIGADEKYCIQCGAKIREFAIFCDLCGKKQE